MEYLTIFAKKIPGCKNCFATQCGIVLSTNDGIIQEMRKGSSYNGYERLMVLTDNGRKQKFVHRLIAETFIENPNKKPFINHKDGNKKNNHVSNLEWVTHQENCDHRENVLGKNSIGSNNPAAKINENDVREIRSLLARGLTKKEIGKRFGISGEAVGFIHYGRTWSHVE